MKYLLPVVFLLLCIGAGCTKKAPAPIAVVIPDRPIGYLEEVKPILDARCSVCHSCYNSPCQLKLNSYEGVDRGGSKLKVYNATRLSTMDPTRLFVDAQTTQEWRGKGFHSVTESSAQGSTNNSLMLQILDHKMKNPEVKGEYYSEADDLTCSETAIELDGYLSKHPNRGMPFGFPPLKKEEFETIAGWLAQGAKGPSFEQQKRLTTPRPEDSLEIKKWETFLNNPDPKHAMTARYLYEHLFLAHIKFDTATQEYFELLRSRTPPGLPVDLIDTVRPYDDPGTDTFYYRFRKIHSTIVHKTHMVFEFDDAKLRRIKELFLEPDWLQEPHLVSYDPVVSANPFTSFAQIPPRSRYQFLLDNAHYIIMTFIRGPVCRGQVALNVINDHFWIMFQDPDYDLSVRYPAFLKLQQKNLIMPIEKGSDFPVTGLIGSKYDRAIRAYYKARQEFYMAHNYNGQGYDAIWKGNSDADAPLLTVYRHFDSASVHKGVLGSMPRTMWVIDYPLLERIYYSLVAGYDVYGAVGHQLASRLYMDGLRREGESYFLGFMPEPERRGMMESWYLGISPEKVIYYDAGIPTGILFSGSNPKREFIEHVVKEHIDPVTGIEFDAVNYGPEGRKVTLPEKYETTDDYLQAFHSVSQPGNKFVSLVDDYNANVMYIRIVRDDGSDTVFSLIINRWHDNVAHLFKEKDTLNSQKDKADLLQGFHGSYPNYFIVIHQRDLPEFFELMTHLDQYEESEARERFDKYGINRSDPSFWEHFDWFQNRFYEDNPVQAGLFDLNRYYHKAF